ncbi:zinc-dependent alcohol dehydrogenase family protein [Paludisphaera soli]|uniref:zinc-dependent alcohol dehydrogenase family protein n=1 Tax=Paludisphaera soli TaxID=2712865 RepID=UPI0013EBEFA0|nr:NAD(P)-dependent alcohol dehydrogenase [Paludisphaera soli]
MKVYRLHDFSGPDGWKLGDEPSPTPGPGEVLVRVAAASINFRDLMISKGIYNPKMRLPRIPLSDAAGEVVANGPGAVRFEPGTRVSANFMARWVDGPLDDEKSASALGGELEGVLAEEVVLPECSLVKIPDSLSFEEAATLPCAAVTAWHGLFETGGLEPGSTVLTLGTGGVSVFAAQFARHAGMRVIATSSSDAKLERIRSLGASETVNYKTEPDWEKPVRDLTDGRGVDLVVEVGGSGTLPKSVRAVRTGGTIALIGVLTGAGQFDPTPILMRGIRLQGVFVGSRAMYEAMNRAIVAHGIKPVVDQVFAFDQAPDALRLMAGASHFGKIVIKV